MKAYAALTVLLALGSIPANGMSFYTTLDSITALNPDVVKARLEAGVARADINTLSALPDPELVGEYMWMPKDVDNRWNVGVEWGFEWFGVYNARKNEARAQADAFSSLALATEAQQRQEIANALTEYQLQKQKLGLLEKMAHENMILIETVGLQAQGGQISTLEANKLTIEAGRFAVRLEDERLALQDIAQKLTLLAGGKDVSQWLDSLDESFTTPASLPSEEEVVANAAHIPAVREAVARTEVARRGVGVARAESGPGITVGYKHLFEDGMHFNGVSLGVTLPFFSSRGKREAANARLLQAEFEAAAARNLAEATARALWHKAESLRKRLEPLRPVFDTTDNLTLLKQQYEGGQISLTDYQTERIYFMEAELEYLDLQARYRTALTDLYLYRF